MAWQEDFRDKVITADEAAGLVKDGQTVRICYGLGEPGALCAALERRGKELRGVRLTQTLSANDYGWFHEGWEDNVTYSTQFVMPSSRESMRAKRADFLPGIPSMYFKVYADGRDDRLFATDVFFVSVSPPDKLGNCSFGPALWYSKSFARKAKLVVGEVNENFIRTYGDNYIHVSELDYLVEHNAPLVDVTTDVVAEDAEIAQIIGAYAATLINDGDTLQIGTGTVSTSIAWALNEKHDLGFHSEIVPPGIITLINEGVVNGRKKTVHTGKTVASVLVAGPDELAYANNNPQIELYEAEYTNNIRLIASHDNMVSVNNALAMDLTGQNTAENLGPFVWSGTGGQLEFTIGAQTSRGGRAITCLPSTAKQSALSRITPMLTPGTVITVPRVFTDFVVTEYGIANLHGKTQRQRAEELIAIAHPDFRAELRKEAQKLFYP